jgi:predicted HicB family RNase H-like nuclease
MKEETKRKQMAFDVAPELHREIKKIAAHFGISINRWMARAIHDRLKKDTYNATKDDMPVLQ